MTSALDHARHSAPRLVLITGCLGGIGRALVEEFSASGYVVLGTDLPETAPVEGVVPDVYVSCDLARFCVEADYRVAVLAQIKGQAKGRLSTLVNNAAWQVVKPIEQLSADDWVKSQNVNVMAPFLLTQGLLAELEAEQGSVVNVASIHAQLTKPEFVAYATSKAALVGMTRALAVELGARVRVNALCPAAIATPMLVAGFDGRPARYQELADMHPVGRIGQPAEAARAARLLADGGLGFMTGATLQLDGGIGARLHDPV